MKKLKLHLDMLAVEAFVTSEQDDEKGTVNGHLRDEQPFISYNNEDTCNNNHTCGGWTCRSCTIGIGCDEVEPEIAG